MRFYSAGLSHVDRAAACIYFYRVIEYYSYLTHENELATLRHDRTVNDQEFARKVLETVVKDEKGALFKVINRLCDAVLLENAKAAGLIQAENASQLADALYKLRNSIVHGKFSYGFNLTSGSIFEPIRKLDFGIPLWPSLQSVQ